MTKEEETIESLKAELAVAKAKLDEQARKKVGWLVYTPKNMAYSGSMFDHQIKFTDGVCFIPKDEEIPYFKQAPLSPGQRETYSKKELAAIDESMKIPTSQQCVTKLESDFHYKVEYFDIGDEQKLIDRLAELKVLAKADIERQNAAQKAMRKAFQERGEFMGFAH